jgi:hypothetical protein
LERQPCIRQETELQVGEGVVGGVGVGVVKAINVHAREEQDVSLHPALWHACIRHPFLIHAILSHFGD